MLVNENNDFKESNLPFNPKKDKPFIKKDKESGEMLAGFLVLDDGKFHSVMEIKNELDIDNFLDKYGLSVVAII